MKDQLIEFETAKLAKEKNFDINCDKYTIDGKIVGCGNMVGKYNAPTQSLLQKWLREKHNTEVETTRIDYKGIENYDCSVELWKKDKNYELKSSSFGITHEETLEKGLIEALKLI